MIDWLNNVPTKTFRWLALCWTLIILYATLTENIGDPGWLSQIPHFDKLVHFGLFLIWASFLSFCFQYHPVQKFYSFIIVMLAGMLLGFLTEYFQAFVPGRSPDPLDFAVDFLGVGMGLGVTFVIKKDE